MSLVAVLGGSGNLGRHVVRGLLDEGHQVRALVHRHTPGLTHRDLVIVHGDVHDDGAVRTLVEGASAVVSTLGSAQSPVPDICSAAIRNLIPAMRTANIARIVVTTGSAAREDREVGREHPNLLARRNMLMVHMADLILDGEEQLRLLAASGLSWTGVRLPRLLPYEHHTVRLSAEPPAPDATAGYGPAATAIVAELEAQAWPAQAPFLRPG